MRDGSNSLGTLMKKTLFGGFTAKCKNFRGKYHMLLAEKSALANLQGHTASVLMGSPLRSAGITLNASGTDLST